MAALSYLDLMVGLRLRLTPAQYEFARVAFDGGVPDSGPEAAELWGAEGLQIPASARRVVAAVCGRGSGKTLLGGTRALHLAMTVDVSGLRKGERALCPIIAPDMAVAQQAVRFALGAAEQLGLRIVQRTAGGEGGFSLIRANGTKVRIAPIAASTKGAAGRGFSIPCAVLDEAAFFRDATAKVNDQDIFDAIRPRIMPGGQVVILSSPWAETGLLFSLWQRNYGHARDALVAHAPTGLMRSDDPQILADIEAERGADPEKTARERDARFMTSNASAFFDARAIAAALIPEEPDLQADSVVTVGGDFAFRRNSSAFVGVQAAWTLNGKMNYSVVDILEKRPAGTPLKPSTICADAAKFAKELGVDDITADGHYREAVAEHLQAHNVSHMIAPEGASGKAEVFQIARALLHEGLVKIPQVIKKDPKLCEKLLRQLREVSARPLAGGGTAIESPLWASGEHGDIVSAFVLALWRAYQLTDREAPKDDGPKYQPDPYERFFMDQATQQDQLIQRAERAIGISLRARR